MKESNDNIELFDKYLQKEMSPDETMAFKSALDIDGTLLEEFNTYKEAVHLLQGFAAGEEMKQIMTSKKSASKKIWPYLAIAASISILVTCYFIFQPATPLFSPQQLFQAYYQAYPNLATVRSSDNLYKPPGHNTTKDTLDINSLAQFNYTGDTLLFYKAISYLSLNQSDSALATLKQISNNSIFNQQVIWYKALAFLNEGEIEECLILLKKIKLKEFGSRESARLLEELGK